MIGGRYTIGEAAKRTGLSVKAIRHYADERVVAPTAVSAAGYRLYSLDDLWRLGLVRILRQLEFGLPEIRGILAGSRDIQTVVRVQRDAIDLQIRRLSSVRSLLARVPEGVWTDTSARHLTAILEAMQMGSEERQRWLGENWPQAVPEEAPAAWRERYLEQVRGILPEDLGAEQDAAWAELKELLVDPRFQDRMQESLRPFWQMIARTPVQPSDWSSAMAGLLQRARSLRSGGRSPSDPEVQALVDDWISVFANAADTPPTPEFMERFAHYAEQVQEEPNRTLWDIMRRLNPDSLELDYEAQLLMIEGLRARMAQDD